MEFRGRVFSSMENRVKYRYCRVDRKARYPPDILTFNCSGQKSDLGINFSKQNFLPRSLFVKTMSYKLINPFANGEGIKYRTNALTNEMNLCQSFLYKTPFCQEARDVNKINYLFA